MVSEEEVKLEAMYNGLHIAIDQMEAIRAGVKNLRTIYFQAGLEGLDVEAMAMDARLFEQLCRLCSAVRKADKWRARIYSRNYGSIETSSKKSSHITKSTGTTSMKFSPDYLSTVSSAPKVMTQREGS